MSKRSLYILCFTLWLPAVAIAAEIIELGADGKSATITQSKDTQAFLLEDYLCALHGQIEVACGLVIGTNDDTASIKFDFVKEPLGKGDKIIYAGGRYPASTIPPVTEASISTSFRRKRVFPFDVSAGAIGGLNYVVPMAHFQGMISTRTSLGIMPILFRRPFQTPTLNAVGGFFTVNFYTGRYYRGFWFGGGVGLYAFSANGARRTTSGAALAHVGYRVGISRGLNVGLAVGAQYISRPQTGADTLEFSEFQGIGMVDLGWNF